MSQIYALIPTSHRPYYAARLKSRAEMYERLTTYGITIIFLYADPSLSEITFKETETSSIFELTVPVPDTYIHISSKEDIAYKYLHSLGADGIIKLDDDVDINDWSCIKELLTTHRHLADYIGISYSIYPSGLHPVNPAHLPLHSLQLFWYLPLEIKFFLGGFYYISRKALTEIIQHGLHFPGEDVSVAYALHQNPEIKPLFKDWFTTKQICWTYESEPIDTTS